MKVEGNEELDPDMASVRFIIGTTSLIKGNHQRKSAQ